MVNPWQKDIPSGNQTWQRTFPRGLQPRRCSPAPATGLRGEDGTAVGRGDGGMIKVNLSWIIDT